VRLEIVPTQNYLVGAGFLDAATQLDTVAAFDPGEELRSLGEGRLEIIFAAWLNRQDGVFEDHPGSGPYRLAGDHVAWRNRQFPSARRQALGLAILVLGYQIYQLLSSPPAIRVADRRDRTRERACGCVPFLDSAKEGVVSDVDDRPGIGGWGARAGVVAPRRPTPGRDGAGLADRQAIVDAISCYAWAYDERDAELLGQVFTEDGIWAGDIQGVQPIGPHQGRDAIVDWLTAFWPIQTDQRRHNFVNVLVETQEASTARALAYLMLTAAEGQEVVVVTTGCYRITLAKAEGTWRISELFAGFDVPF
jgi:SnoaL-like domain